MTEILTNLLASIKYPLFTEKSLKLTTKNGQYSFIVRKKLSKIEIKEIIEKLFNVKVSKINTIVLPKKISSKNKVKGYYSQYKKAIIKLKEGFILNDLLTTIL